jgi:hypothetical protein
MITIGSFRISQFYYSYSFVLKSLSKRLSIQYVYERVFLVFACFSKRVQNYNFFFNLQEKFKVFFETFFSSHFFIFLTSLSRNFPCFAGCKCNIRFPFSQAFLNLFLKKFSNSILLPVSISVNVYRCCGCKSTTFIYIYKPFYYIISIFFKPFS